MLGTSPAFNMLLMSSTKASSLICTHSCRNNRQVICVRPGVFEGSPEHQPEPSGHSALSQSLSQLELSL